MMVRPSERRGLAEHGWLHSRHTFSFAEYYDPEHMGYRALRVINEDNVEPGRGFGTHPHRDMEIITYVLQGALEHADSMGNGSVIRPGDVQRMSAGTGVSHSEFNHSSAKPVRFLQIWIEPERLSSAPSYEQKHFSARDKYGRLCLVASHDGRDESVMLHQDVDIYAAMLDPEQVVAYDAPAGRHLWVQVARGVVQVSGQLLVAGDGAAITGGTLIEISGADFSELLLFDLA